MMRVMMQSNTSNLTKIWYNVREDLRVSVERRIP